jgi:23S rRNA pseudouridine1911/1915/1917 synthase
MPRPVDVLFEDNHLLVLNKPAMIATMGAAPGEPSLLDDAREYIRVRYAKPGNVYLGVVSRLDAFVSGVIVFARTSKAAARLNGQFAGGDAKKLYWALIPDRDSLPDAASWEHHLYKDDSRKRMFARSDEDTSLGTQSARLRYRTVARSEDVRWVEVELLTGRKHQIRAQFSAEGCPIIGDRKYGSRIEFPRGIALHSRSLELSHPVSKERLKFEADPPFYWNLQGYSL